MTPSTVDRRTFLAISASSVPLLGAAPTASGWMRGPNRAAGPVSVSSGNGLKAVERACEMMRGGSDPCDAVVDGVAIVEADPDDMSVGYGGLPNEEGVVQLDSSVMHGPSHKAGAVAAIENIKHPAAVALRVLRRTDHVLIVGEGAYRFARAQGFPHEEMLTEKARRAWQRWKRNLNPNDDWLDDEQIIRSKDDDGHDENNGDGHVWLDERRVPHTWGTIHCSGLNLNGDIGACTTTSGLSWKIPGRVGDSPIVGAGMFVDNEVGSGGATGRGESCIQSCAAFQIVQNMSRGDDPAEACLSVLKWIATHTKRHDLLNERGEPNFGATLYALRKDGLYGSATMRGRAQFAVCDAKGPRHERCVSLYEA